MSSSDKQDGKDFTSEPVMSAENHLIDSARKRREKKKSDEFFL